MTSLLLALQLAVTVPQGEFVTMETRMAADIATKVEKSINKELQKKKIVPPADARLEVLSSVYAPAVGRPGIWQTDVQAVLHVAGQAIPINVSGWSNMTGVKAEQRLTHEVVTFFQVNAAKLAQN
jgi:hypothetical protein